MGIVSFRWASGVCYGCIWGGIVAIREVEKRIKTRFERRKKRKNDKTVKKERARLDGLAPEFVRVTVGVWWVGLRLAEVGEEDLELAGGRGVFGRGGSRWGGGHRGGRG